jgi:hypothetical protein
MPLGEASAAFTSDFTCSSVSGSPVKSRQEYRSAMAFNTSFTGIFLPLARNVFRSAMVFYAAVLCVLLRRSPVYRIIPLPPAAPA